MNVSIDRIDDGIAVLIGMDDATVRMTVPVSALPPGSSEGDIITLSLERDGIATDAARKRVIDLQEKLKKRR
jgi:hypothetical protein